VQQHAAPGLCLLGDAGREPHELLPEPLLLGEGFGNETGAAGGRVGPVATGAQHARRLQHTEGIGVGRNVTRSATYIGHDEQAAHVWGKWRWRWRQSRGLGQKVYHARGRFVPGAHGQASAIGQREDKALILPLVPSLSQCWEWEGRTMGDG